MSHYLPNFNWDTIPLEFDHCVQLTDGRIDKLRWELRSCGGLLRGGLFPPSLRSEVYVALMNTAGQVKADIWNGKSQ